MIKFHKALNMFFLIIMKPSGMWNQSQCKHSLVASQLVHHHHSSILEACDLMGKLAIQSSGWKLSNCSDRAISSKDNSGTVQSPCRYAILWTWAVFFYFLWWCNRSILSSFWRWDIIWKTGNVIDIQPCLWLQGHWHGIARLEMRLVTVVPGGKSHCLSIHNTQGHRMWLLQAYMFSLKF